MNFSNYFLLGICLSNIIGETSPFPGRGYLEGIADGDQSNITGSKNHTNLRLSKRGEIYRKDKTLYKVLVWKGTYNQTIDVAIKIISEEDNWQEEMTAYKALKATEDFDIEKHRIPRVYYGGPFLGKYFAIAMTLFEETLEERWEQLKREGKKLSESTFLLIFKQAVESLSYIHSKNVTHNDLHPGNIFIRGKDVFIADFDASYLGGNFMDDYNKMVSRLGEIVGMESNISNDEKVKCFQNKNVREAFRSILNTEPINGKFGLVPDYNEIIKISKGALKKFGRPVQFEWLNEGGHASSSGY